MFRVDKSLEKRKVEIIFDLFIDAADEDYIVARWAFCNGMFRNFYSSAGQAVEKYLKAALLLQDQSTIGYGHKLSRLYDDVSGFDLNKCLPSTIILPGTTAHGRDMWEGKALVDFVRYLEVYGSPDNRYSFHGEFISGHVLHILDIICYSIRIFMICTNFVEGSIFELCSMELFEDEKIINPKEWMISPKSILEMIYFDRYKIGHGKSLKTTFLNMNMCFSDHRCDGEQSFGGYHFRGSPLHNHLVRLGQLDNSKDNVIIINELRDWIEEKVQMSKAIKDKLGYLNK